MIGLFTSSLATFLAFYALAGILGAGTSAVTYSKAVVEKFDRRRGIALGIVAGGLGAAGLFLPPLMGIVIADSGWRAAYLTMALLGALPFVLVFFARLSAPASVAAVDRSTLPGLTVADRPAQPGVLEPVRRLLPARLGAADDGAPLRAAADRLRSRSGAGRVPVVAGRSGNRHRPAADRLALRPVLRHLCRRPPLPRCRAGVPPPAVGRPELRPADRAPHRHRIRRRDRPHGVPELALLRARAPSAPSTASSTACS